MYSNVLQLHFHNVIAIRFLYEFGKQVKDICLLNLLYTFGLPYHADVKHFCGSRFTCEGTCVSYVKVFHIKLQV